MSSSSSLFLSIVLLLLASSAGEQFSVARETNAGEQGLTRIRMYMHEMLSGPNTTAVTIVPPSPLGGNTTFGMVRVLDNELRDGPDRSNSSLVGRFQGIVVSAGLVSPPGVQSAISFVFMAGEHAGGTLIVQGTIPSFVGAFERPVVGGTGPFRMARGYCITMLVSNPMPEYTVYQIDLFVKMDA
uniref:Uncharacterized protein n=1 Tax=Avena sativa TaxID=4498 RepID=A0ACD5YEN8_AVESA